MKKFYPNDGRPSTEITSTEDVRNYIGTIMNNYDRLEIERDWL